MTTLGPTLDTARERTAHWVTYPRFLYECARIAFEGDARFYAWMTALTGIALVGANAWAQQLAQGMVLTNMTDHVSWGIYIANFTFMVGLAAGGVMMVIPAYLYDDHEMHDVVILGELLAIAAIVMALAFVTVDLGRPDRFWHMMPLIGRFHWPASMLTWDVIVLSGYLLINLHICGYLLYTRFLGRRLEPRWYVPFVMVSVAWAISIHTVTAFLYSGLGGRPFWNSAILAPRFIASAFVTGPAFLILALELVRRLSAFRVPQGPTQTLASILRVTCVINLFMLVAEVFTEFYTGGSHVAPARYLFFGLHGKSALVPWIWSAIALNVTAAVLLLSNASRRSSRMLELACVLTFAGVWIEKGMGLIIPAFVPSTLHEVVEYLPSLTEWKVVAGVWAVGLGLFTVAVKIAIHVLTGRSRLGPPAPQRAAAPAASHRA
jgi:molybdopterin-containing oxidoreductase family membrane subunit